MTPTTVAIVILTAAALVVLVFLVLNSQRGRRSFEDVPPAMRPGYSDEELERRVLERYMGWGLVLTLFFAAFFPGYWLFETRRLQAEEQSFFVESVVRGEEEYTSLCAECHGTAGDGGAAPAPDGEGTWPAPALTNIVARYQENLNIDDIEDFIFRTVERGRPGTPMPTFGSRYGGPLTDQAIQDIANWILANQVDPEDPDAVAEAQPAGDLSGEELFVNNCAKCHGAELQGGVAPTLIGVFERHEPATVLNILRDGIYVPTGAIMPPWQNGYMYPDARYDDEALQSIVDYLAEQQPDDPAEVELEQEGIEPAVPPGEADEPEEADPEDAPGDGAEGTDEAEAQT